MDITKKIDDFYTSTSDNIDVEYDEKLFERTLNLIIDLDPEILDEEQLGEIESILSNIELYGEDDITEVRLAKKSTAEKRRMSKGYYRRNKAKVKLKRKKFKRSAEGKKRKRKTKLMGKSGKTATGRKKVRYH